MTEVRNSGQQESPKIVGDFHRLASLADELSKRLPKMFELLEDAADETVEQLGQKC